MSLQGFGLLTIKNALYLDGRTSRYLFVDGKWSPGCGTCPTFTASGQSRTYTFIPTDATVPLKITVAWHDKPTTTTITNGALVNNIDLRAVHASTTYYANGGTTDDTVNNVEQIIISTPTVGTPVTVTIAAKTIAFGPQPYAVAVTGMFKRDSSLYPDIVPIITSYTSSGQVRQTDEPLS